MKLLLKQKSVSTLEENMVEMKSRSKEGYEISTEKQETYNNMDEICVHLFIIDTRNQKSNNTGNK